MRKIKFKAKQLNSGEWLEGDLVHLGNRVFIGGDNIKDGITGVDPSTVCQFTGLTDCEGKEIWEGNMIKSPYLENVVTVEWNDSLCGFKCVDNKRYINYSLKALVESSGWSLIGNKFDDEK